MIFLSIVLDVIPIFHTGGQGQWGHCTQPICPLDPNSSDEEKAEVESNPSFSKKSSYHRPGTWTNITITSNLLQNMEEPLSPAEDKVKLLELRMMMEEMERMVGLLEEEMRDLQMRVEMDWMSLVTLASLVTSPLAGVRPGR